MKCVKVKLDQIDASANKEIFCVVSYDVEGDIEHILERPVWDHVWYTVWDSLDRQGELEGRV